MTRRGFMGMVLGAIACARRAISAAPTSPPTVTPTWEAEPELINAFVFPTAPLYPSRVGDVIRVRMPQYFTIRKGEAYTPIAITPREALAVVTREEIPDAERRVE